MSFSMSMGKGCRPLNQQQLAAVNQILVDCMNNGVGEKVMKKRVRQALIEAGLPLDPTQDLENNDAKN